MSAHPQGPLFIVGPSRSGTAMLRSVVMRSPHIELAGETHYFDDLRPRFTGRILADLTEEERIACCDYFRVQTVRPYGKGGDPDDSWISRQMLLDKAQTLPDTGTDTLFEAYCRLMAERTNASVWGEKTPRHVLRIDDILERFPDAKVMCMVRDPRAVVASYRDWQYQGGLPVEGNEDYEKSIAEDEERARKSYHIVIATMMWRAAANASLAALAKHGDTRVRVIKYEDLVADPETRMTEVCTWLGITYDASLLEVPLHNSSSEKFTAGAGISKAPQGRWKKVLSPREVGVIQRIAGGTFNTLGYEMTSDRAGAVGMASAYATLPGAVVRAVRANRDRYDSLPKYLVRRARAALNV